MGLGRLRRSEERATSVQLLQQLGVFGGMSKWRPGQDIGLMQGLRNSAAYACIDLKASSIAETPLDVVRYQGTTRVPIPSAPQVIARPSGMVGPDVWRYQLAWSIFTDGNAFAYIAATDSMMRPTQLELIDPYSVKNRKVVDGVPQVHIASDVHQLYPHGDVWHLAGGMCSAGTPFAMSPLTAASTAIGTSLAAEDFGANFFSSGGHPTTIIRTEGDPGDEAATRTKKRFLEASTNREPVLLPKTVGIERIQIDPNDSQFIDLLRFEIENVCRFFRTPPNMIYGAVSGQSVTYQNVTDADLNYLKRSLSWPYTLVENALSRIIPAPQVAKFNRDAVLRADTRARYEAHEIALRNKWRTINEVRSLEDEAPFDGDEFNTPGLPETPAVVRDEPVAVRNEPEPALLEVRDMEPVIPNITVNMPEQRTTINTSEEMQREAFTLMAQTMAEVLERQDAPQVHVTVEPTPVTVNVAAPNVTNDVQPAEVHIETITIPAPNVTIDAPVTVNVPEQAPAVFDIKRDRDGKIKQVVEE
jgi:HK97 family phage portal protein